MVLVLSIFSITKGKNNYIGNILGAFSLFFPEIWFVNHQLDITQYPKSTQTWLISLIGLMFSIKFSSISNEDLRPDQKNGYGCHHLKCSNNNNNNNSFYINWFKIIHNFPNLKCKMSHTFLQSILGSSHVTLNYIKYSLHVFIYFLNFFFWIWTTLKFL